MPKVILFGANGMLGRYFHRYLGSDHEVIAINRRQFDVLKSNFLDLDQLLIDVGCDQNTVIINCVGMIPQRNDLVSSMLAFLRVNGEFPHLLNAIAQKLGCHFIHITTDCVYNGEKGQYSESDQHTEKSIYGKSKSLGEPCTATVIRTSIIGEESENKRSLLEWVRSQNHQTINGYDNHLWNGVTCLQLAKIVNQIITSGEYWSGVRHIYSPTSVSKYDLVSMIVSAYNLKIKIVKHIADVMCDKTLISNYQKSRDFNIPELLSQIEELVKFSQIVNN